MNDVHKLQPNGIIRTKKSLKAEKVTSRIETNYSYKGATKKTVLSQILNKEGKREIYKFWIVDLVKRGQLAKYDKLLRN